MKRIFVLLVPLFLVGNTASSAPAPRPNILYLYVDDMGWGSLGPNAQFARREQGEPYVLTPNLDRLAARSINFKRAYGCTVCSPARSSQQTGFHQGHTFADRNDPNNAKKAIRKEDVTMGDALSKAGYTTAYWGKWGYGGSKDQADPSIDNVQTLPTSHGYEFVLAELHHVRAHTFFQPTLWSAPAKPGAAGGLELIPNSMAKYAGKAGYPNQPALQNHPEYPETAYCDDSYCLAALDFVRTQAKRYSEKGEPFFGLLAVQVPHAPFDEIQQLPEWNKDYKTQPGFSSLKSQTQQWAAMVTRIDGHIGNLLDSLEDPNGDGDQSDSVTENTLVIFQSDNGGPGGAANEELDTNGGLRGTKGSIYEGGIRVPTMMSWPAKITAESKWKPGTSSDHVIDVTDLLPTFCELAGAEIPVGLDGVSLAPTLLGEIEEQRVRKFVIHEAGKSQSIIRGKDKLIRNGKKLELYDLEKDRAETNNLVKGKQKLVKELEVILHAERTSEPRGFANTYHQWTGGDGAITSDPGNWSDYEYANAGISYLKDGGAPQASWNAKISNDGPKASKALADRNLEFLGLEVGGGKSSRELQLAEGVTLTGRNEVRISEKGILSLKGGVVSSKRWVDVRLGGEIRGKGKIEATLYNSGKVDLVSIDVGDFSPLIVEGNYQESEEALLSLEIGEKEGPAALSASGYAVLAGELRIEAAGLTKLAKGIRYPVLRAKEVRGKFSNNNDSVLVSDGTPLRIHYSKKEVSVSVMNRDDRS